MSIKIGRFLSLRDAGLLFDVHANNTFCLCTQHYYYQLWKDGDHERGDENESRADFQNGSHKIVQLANCSFISCWSVIDNESNLRWDIFNFKPDVVIISDNSAVGKFLQTHFEHQLKARAFNFQEGRVQYHDGTEPSGFNLDQVAFMKNKKYERQNEYRFILKYLPPSPIFQKIVFYIGFPGTGNSESHFATKIIFNPRLLNNALPQEEERLLKRVVIGLIAENMFNDQRVPQYDEILLANKPK